jgi:hypothetical protein
MKAVSSRMHALILMLLAVLVQGCAVKPAGQDASSSSNGAPYGMIAYYTATSGQNGIISCPSGWSAFQPALGYMVLATTDPNQFEQTQGTALSGDLSQPTHTHPYSMTANVDYHSSVGGSGKSPPLAQSGTHSLTGVSDAGTTGYGFIQYVMCESINQQATDQMPIGSIAYFDTNVTNGGCPSNWGPLNSANGYFIMAGNPNWNIGTPSPGAAQQGNPNWNVTVPFPTHGHSSNTPLYTFTPPVVALSSAAMGQHLKSMDNEIDVYATLDSNTEPVVPAIALLVCQKTSGASNANGVPTNIAFYFSSTTGCPTGSGPAAGAGGTFPLGIPAGGNPSLGNYETQGAVLGTPWSPSTPNPGHTHGVTANLDLGDLSSPYYPGSSTHYAQGGTYTVTGQSGSTSIQLPFVQYLLCSANT